LLTIWSETIKPTLLNLSDNSIGTLLANVIYQDIGTKFPIHMSVCTPESSTCASDDHSLAIKTNRWRRLGIWGKFSGYFEFALCKRYKKGMYAKESEGVIL
jgi:hypothetical protein